VSTVQLDAAQVTADLEVLRQTIDAGGLNQEPAVRRVNIASFGALVLGVATQAEILAADYITKDAAAADVFVPGSVIVGQRRQAVNEAPDSAVKRHYLYVQGLLRWFPENIDTPRKGVPFIQLPGSSSIPAPDPARVSAAPVAPPALWVVIGVIGVAASAAAAIAYWAGKREDAQAQVAISTMRQVSTADVASKAIQAQIKAGQPVDPALIKVLDTMATPESASSWGVWLAGGLAFGLTLGAVGTAAVMERSKR